VAHHFRVNWKTIAAVVEGAVLWGLQHRRRDPLHVIGLDEVSRRKGQHYLTIVYDLGRGRVVWVGRDRDATHHGALLRVAGPAPGARDSHSLLRHVEHLYRRRPDAPARAAVVFDRFHLSQHLSRAVDEVCRQTWRQLQGAEQAEFKRTRFLWLKNPENLARDERTRWSTLLRLNSPIVKAYLLKEDLRRFWTYRSTAWAGGHLLQWLWRASHSRLTPFQKLARMLHAHLDGVLVWTKLRVSNGALEGMNNKVKVISHRAYGYRTSWTYIANIYHCCAGLPMP
jgi:transposase